MVQRERPNTTTITAFQRLFANRQSRGVLIISAAIVILAGISAVIASTRHERVTHPREQTGVASAAPTMAASGASTAPTHSAATAAMTSSSSSGIKTSAIGNASPRQVIETATLDVQTAHVHQISSHLQALVEQYGGFVASLQESDDRSAEHVTMKVRIPENHLTDFLHGAKSTGTVTRFAQTGQDVTQQVQGVQQSISQLQSEAAAYSRLFNKAQTMKDMLQIQQSLTQVDSQISDLQAQAHQLKRSVQLATVNLSITPTPKVTGVASSPMQTHVWKPLNASVHALGQSAIALITLFAWIVPWAAIAAIVWGGWRLWMRRRAAKRTC